MEYHVPILAPEITAALRVGKTGVYADGTLGGGGHSEQILKAGALRVIGIDRDGESIEFASRRLTGYGDRFTAVRSDFKGINGVLDGLGLDFIDGAVLDLGISSRQIDEPERGFSYMQDAPLDMRMDIRQGLTAETVVNEYSEDELVKVIYGYGEESFARRIAREIIRRRAEARITRTGELAGIIKAAVPRAKQNAGHPAKKAFQAIRIEVNGELDGLGQAAEDFIRRLKPGGRLCVLTFHSLEDRIIKQKFRDMAAGCICDKSLPVCVCGHKPEIKLINNKPITAGQDEVALNSRAAPAKLRIAERI